MTIARLRGLTVALGILWAAVFVLVGLTFQLQFYGDGSAFSYGVALSQNWAMHWHNLVTRIVVYLLCIAPAEGVANLSQSAATGIAVYALLFFGAQIACLVTTYLCDRSPGRVIFVFACASTAVSCPLVWGFPTEMWIAHAVLWPALAVSHFAKTGPRGWLAVSTAFVALVLTHEGALILAVAIAATTMLHGWLSGVARRAVTAFAFALALWLVAQIILPPDAYFAPVFAHASRNFFDPHVFTSGIFARLTLALFILAAIMTLLRRLSPLAAASVSTLMVAAALSADWIVASPQLHAENRYYLRTALVVLTPAFASIAALFIPTTSNPPLLAQFVGRARRFMSGPRVVAFAGAALVVAALIHVVETARFLAAWSAYRGEIVQLITEPAERSGGTGAFVSSMRISAPLQPLAWSSTTPFMSILIAPDFSPSRLVVDPSAGYFWLTCSLSRQNEATGRTLPRHALGLIRDYSCLHRLE